MKSLEIDTRGYGCIILLLGTKNIETTNSPADMSQKYSSLLNAISIPNTNAKIVVLSILPRPKDFEYLNEKTTEFNSALKALAHDKKCDFQNIYKSFMCRGKKVPNEDMFSRRCGLHPSTKGNKLLRALICMIMWQ